jgi:predicted  nucleic acid-binding Zn-ribbon protein
VSTIIERLLIIQDRDRKITHLMREAKDLPARIQEIKSRLDIHRESMKTAHEDMKKNAAATKQAEVEIDSRKQKIMKFREQQLQIKSNDEYRILEHEIAVVQGEIRNLEDQELALMEQAENLRKAIAEREKDLKQEEGRANQDEEVLKKRLENIQAEIHDLQVDRDSQAAGTDPTWLARYDRIFKRTADYALVPVENAACGGCHMKLPPHLVHEAKRGLAMTQCSFCSRILYWQP